MDQPHSVGPPPGSFPVPPNRGGHSNLTLTFTAIAALMLGIIIGVGTMFFFAPSAESDTVAAADASVATSVEAVPATTAAPAAKPKVDPRVAAAAAKLAKLRKKIKRTRSKQVDPECAKYFKGKYSKGYVYSGGKFDEQQFVAGASGCVAVAKAAKAPWFCCPR